MAALVTYLVATSHPFAVLAYGCLVGSIAGATVMRAYDNNWERLWRVPMCRPGHCYCRTTCACFAMESENGR